MEWKAIFLRDRSNDSEVAAALLQDSNIDYSEVFSSSADRVPAIVSPESAYAYEGIAGVRRFIEKMTQRDSE